MKKIVILLLCLMFVLCACGDTTPTDATTDPTVTTAGSQSTEPSGGTTDPSESQPGQTELSAKALAESCIGKTVEELIDLIGEPESSDYAPSCLNPGEADDGMLFYDGFIVYTYRTAEMETVDYVE